MREFDIEGFEKIYIRDFNWMEIWSDSWVSKCGNLIIQKARENEYELISKTNNASTSLYRFMPVQSGNIEFLLSKVREYYYLLENVK